MESRIIEWIQAANFSALQANLEGLKKNKKIRITINLQGNNVTLSMNLIHLVVFSFNPTNQEERTRSENLISFMVEQVGISVNDVNDWNETPLMLATKLHRYCCIKFLVERYGADIEIVSLKDGRTAMMTSLESNLEADYTNPFYFDIALYFLRERHANVGLIDLFGFNCLHIAVSSENYDAIYYLVRNRSSLLDLKARINNPESSLNSFNALDIAARFDSYNVIEILVQEAGLDPNQTNNKGDTPFMTACMRGFVNCCQRLQENGTVMITHNPLTDMTYLHVSSSKGYVQITNIILNSPIVMQNLDEYLNIQTRKGTTALHLASIPSKPSLSVQILTNFENAEDENNIRLLVDTGAVDSEKRTALHFACLKNLAKNYAVDKELVTDALIGKFSKEICEILLLRDPSLLNKQDKHGRTALMLALKYDLQETIYFLLSFWDDLDTDLMDEDGKRACDYVNALGNRDLYDFLKTFMVRKEDLKKMAFISKDLYDSYIKNKKRDDLVFFVEMVDSKTLEKSFQVMYKNRNLVRKEVVEQADRPEIAERPEIEDLYLLFPSIILYTDDFLDRLDDNDIFWIVDSGDRVVLDGKKGNIFQFRGYFFDETVNSSRKEIGEIGEIGEIEEIEEDFYVFK